MEACLNINTPKFEALRASGLSEFELKAYTRYYLDKFDRYPHLDELPHANSEPYLRENLNIKENNSLNKSDLFILTGADSVELANVILNDIYRDLNINLTELGNEVLIDIKHRPECFVYKIEDDTVDWNDSAVHELSSSVLFFNKTIKMLSKKLGIGIKTISSDDITNSDLNSIIPNAWATKAFVHDGTIYINTDNATLDSPIHELMHIFIGSLRYTNPEYYQKLLNSVEGISDYQNLLSKYKRRTRNDANEEILVDKFAKYITGLDENSTLFTNPEEIFYNIDRMLDLMLEGLISSRTIPFSKKASMSMIDLGKRLHSNSLIPTESYCSITAALQHQINNNIKKDLLSKGYLTEECS